MVNHNQPVVLIYQRMLDYHKARFNALSSELAKQGKRCFAIEIASLDSSYGDIDNYEAQDFQHESRVITLFPNTDYLSLQPAQVSSAVCNALTQLTPSVIFTPAPAFSEGAGAFRYKVGHDCKLILMDDAWAATDVRGKITSMIKRMFYGFVDGGFFPAKLHAEYFASLNIPIERQRYAVNVVGAGDTESFDHEIASKKNTLLFVGRLIKRKRLDLILEAIAQIRNPELRLTIIGDGPERYHLEQLSIKLGIKDQVEWLGAKKNNVVRAYMRRSIAVLVPSDFEQWGLVVNEAWLSSTLVLGSDQVGALVATSSPQMRWMMAPAGDVAAWVKALKKLLSLSDAERLELQHQTQLIAHNYSMLSHIESALALINIAPRPKPTFVFGLLVKLWRGRVRVW